MKIIAYVSSSSGAAIGVGKTSRLVRLQHVKPDAPTRPGEPAVAGPNDPLFDAGQNGDINMTLNGVTADVKAFLEEGKAYVITIEPVPAA